MAQQVPERLRALGLDEAGSAARRRGTSTTSPTSSGRSSRPSTRDERLEGVDDRAADDLARTDDDRADGRQVRGDRRDDEVAARSGRGSGRRPRTSSRSSRSGSTTTRPSAMNVARWVSSIATSSRQTRASEPRATTMSLRAKWRVCVDRAAAAQDQALERHPLVDREPAGDDLAEDGSSSPASAFDRKPTLPRLTPRIGHVDLGDGPGRAQERAVATEHDQRIGRRQLADERARCRPTGAATRRCRGPGTSPRPARSARPPPRSSGCRRSRSADGHGPVDLGDRARRSRRSRARARGGRGTRGCPRDR